MLGKRTTQKDEFKIQYEELRLSINKVYRQKGSIGIFAHTQDDCFIANLDEDMLGRDGVHEIIDSFKNDVAITLGGIVKRYKQGNIELACFSLIIDDY